LASDKFVELFLQAIERNRQFLIMADKVRDFPDIGAAEQSYADALGKSVDSLTDTERKQAFLNVILSEAE